MFEEGWAGALMRWLRIVVRVVLLNVLVILHALAGLVLFGLFPALSAGARQVDALWRGELDETPIVSFHEDWRRAFRPLIPIGMPFWALSLLGICDLAITARSDSAVMRALAAPVLLLTMVVLVAGLVAVWVWNRYEKGPGATIRLSVVLLPLQPLHAVAALAALVVALTVERAWPVLVPLAGVSLPLVLLSPVVVRALDRFELRSRRATGGGPPSTRGLSPGTGR